MTEREKQDLRSKIRARLLTPKSDNVFYLRYALQLGMTIDELYRLTKIDRWFLFNIQQIVDLENELRNVSIREADLAADISS
jgi:carbamoyl-phosphate synthase large subunit